ncbi:hypothetical protein [Actinomadura rupiterrae]|uniref:hypothetical protein n=1 Tax=Actinomadura rupiterrae TaxID=559627 RepID=UPI0020A48468|nr:hypothetical protein [Actinomadura rupiterrae]MCP2337530.1 hypothetical protein [Actinomadura rupiterrae]
MSTNVVTLTFAQHRHQPERTDRFLFVTMFRRNPRTNTVHPHHVVAHENGHRQHPPQSFVLAPSDSQALYINILNVAEHQPGSMI